MNELYNKLHKFRVSGKRDIYKLSVDAFDGHVSNRKNAYGQFLSYTSFKEINFKTANERVESILENYRADAPVQRYAESADHERFNPVKLFCCKEKLTLHLNSPGLEEEISRAAGSSKYSLYSYERKEDVYLIELKGDRDYNSLKVYKEGEKWNVKPYFNKQHRSLHNLGVVLVDESKYSYRTTLEKIKASTMSLINCRNVNSVLVTFPDIQTLIRCAPEIVELDENERISYRDAEKINELIIQINEVSTDSQFSSPIVYAFRYNVTKNETDVGGPALNVLETESKDSKALIFLAMAYPEPLLVSLYWALYIVSDFNQPDNVLLLSEGIEDCDNSSARLIKNNEKYDVALSYGIVKQKQQSFQRIIKQAANLPSSLKHTCNFKPKFEWLSWTMCINPIFLLQASLELLLLLLEKVGGFFVPLFMWPGQFAFALDYHYFKLLDRSVGLCISTPHTFNCYKWDALMENSCFALKKLFYPLYCPEKIGWSDNLVYLRNPFAVLNGALAYADLSLCLEPINACL
mmetsp:Transcript_34088/g.59454  ORF Transcript_34088/g.59454 Transcript_34088/m.59454 type:complete len:520 (-) Transcript_34088:879-2438(-)